MRERLRLLRHPAFRNLWIASSASVMGDSIVIVALALFVTDLTGSATEVGIVLAAQLLPFVAFLLIGGVWADRLVVIEALFGTSESVLSPRPHRACAPHRPEIRRWPPLSCSG